MNDVSNDLDSLYAMVDGKTDGLSRLYDSHAAVMLRVAFRILGNRRDAEDLLHDVFLEAWQKAASFDPARGSVRNWLLIRVRSRAIDRIRTLRQARRLLQTADNQAQPLDVEVDDDLSQVADGSAARAALTSLPPEQLRVVELGYFQGFSCSEIAERCQIPIGTVKSRLAAALDKLRRQLRPTREDGRCHSTIPG